MNLENLKAAYLNGFVDVKPEVAEALKNNKPVVALESTIISHGFPYPENLECARESEKNIRENGAVPATIAIIKGRIKIGLEDSDIQYLAENRTITKVSRRDIPVIVSLGRDGATTVATTMMLAAMAGIKVFATGGIGGVHRHAQQTFDISADLEELANTGVAVVCAGAKSILDIGLTKEYLETHGVPVIGYQTEEIPSFYTRKSGFKADYRIDSPEEIAKAIHVKERLGLKGGFLITNPIPEESEMDHELIGSSIDAAVKEAEEKGVLGKEITPFLLARIHETTKGKSVEANKALVFNNARLAAKVATALSKIAD